MIFIPKGQLNKMAEDTLESGQSPVSEEQPVPTFTEKADSQISTVDPKAIAMQVAEILRPDFEKMAQSTKDKRIAKLEKAVGSLAELEDMGVQIPENVKVELRNRELEQRLEAIEGRAGSVQKPASQGSGTVDANEWVKVVEEVGLDMKSPETIAFLRGEYRNIDHFTSEAYRLKSKLDSSPNPTSATTSSLKVEKAAQSDVNALATEYDQLAKNPSQNWKRMTEIREVLDKEIR